MIQFLSYKAKMSLSKNVINRYNLKLTKKYGQNFLNDESVLKDIIEVGNVSEDDLILEIGAGAGALTIELAKKAGHVLAIEIDRNLIPVLNDVLYEYKNIDIINEDVLKMNFSDIIPKLLEKHNLKKAKVIANLPYYITTPIIMNFLEGDRLFEKFVFMVQKEVAQRMVANPGKKDYGALTLAVNFYTNPKLEFLVPSNCFIPKPDVDSAVISLDAYEKSPVEINSQKLLFEVIKAAFSQRRKLLVNCLVNNLRFPISKNDYEEILENMGINIQARGETLSLSQFADLSNIIYSKINSK